MSLLQELVEQSSDDGKSPTKTEVYRAACDYVEADLSLIPISADGRKMPAFPLLPRVWCEEEQRRRAVWSCFKEQRPAKSQLKEWFRDSDGEYGFAVLGGKVSGGLEIIDCDNWEVAERWAERVERKAPDLLRRLVLVRSPRPGLHAYYRCKEFSGNRKVARVPDREKDNKKPKTIIEIKGEAGYCVAPPSPAACHKAGRCYTFLGDRDLSEIPTIKPRERELLICCAMALDCWAEPRRPPAIARRPARREGPLRPGDDFNLRADWQDVLRPHGWSWVRRGGDGSDLWLRPGKYNGVSASTNYAGSDLLFVFSSNAEPFEECTAYSKFHAYALLQHDGDFRAAARELSKRGYGQRRSRPTQETSFARYASYRTRSARIGQGRVGHA